LPACVGHAGKGMAAIILSTGLAMASAFAQAGGSVSPADPLAGMPVQSLPLPALAPSGGAVATSASGVEVGSLGDVTPDYAGPLEEGGGGFPLDMWKGTDRALVERLLPQLPVALASPAMRDLERRLLLTNAEAPAGKSGGANLFSLRADRLAAMGLSRDAAGLLALMPAHMADKISARLRIDSLLLSGDVDGACRALDDTRAAASADSYWQQAQVFCQLRAGQADKAALGLDLLRDQGPQDAAFFKLADALGGGKVALASLPSPSALELAMLRQAKIALPPDAVRSHSPSLLAAIAEDPGLDTAVRLAAAEQAAAIGGLAIDRLQEAYTRMFFPPGGLEDPIAASAADPGPKGRARLYQATGATAQLQDRARLLQAALERARRQGGYLLAVQVNMIYLLPIAPAPDLAWFAGDAGRALFAAGHLEQANAWLELARSRAAGDPRMMASAAALAVYARIAGVGAPLAWDPAALAAWRASAGASAGGERLVAIFDGLGEPMGGGWSTIGATPISALSGSAPVAMAPADPAVLLDLSEAATRHRIGETVLLALYALGPGGPAGCNPLSLSRVIASLRLIGLDNEARAIAIEAAIAAGV
jgi:hypothetical protein